MDVGREALEMLSRTDAARLLSLSLRTLDRRIASGDLEAVKDGTRVLIAPEAVADYKARLRASAARPAAA
jgi:excisionase family DNA binding protein